MFAASKKDETLRAMGKLLRDEPNFAVYHYWRVFMYARPEGGWTDKLAKTQILAMLLLRQALATPLIQDSKRAIMHHVNAQVSIARHEARNRAKMAKPHPSMRRALNVRVSRWQIA